MTDDMNSEAELKPCPFCGGEMKYRNGYFAHPLASPSKKECPLDGQGFENRYQGQWQSRPIEAALREEIEDYKEVLADKRRLTRELDVAMHGEENAAQQASLCDLIGPAKALQEENERLREALGKIANVCSENPDATFDQEWAVEKIMEYLEAALKEGGK